MSKKDKLIRGAWTKGDLRGLKLLFPNRSTADVAKHLGRPTEAVKKRASRLGLRKSAKYMKALGRTCLFMLALCLFAGTARAQDANDAVGLTAWTLGGTQTQEVRVGYEGLLPNIEFAAGGKHKDAPELSVEQWAFRGYAIAHALDADMVASFLGNKITLPSGNLYGGLFAEYSHDRDEEWSGGYVVGALVDWPKGWATVAEYGQTLFNTDQNEYEFMLGLRRQF